MSVLNPTDSRSAEPVLPSVAMNSSRPVDRRGRTKDADQRAGRNERRQFGSSHSNLSTEGRELAAAIDAYKIQHHRRYITCDEMLVVLRSLGYQK
ncbi:MAG: hypothetical protein AAF745_11420 [Planctomycetota bacterium]